MALQTPQATHLFKSPRTHAQQQATPCRDEIYNFVGDAHPVCTLLRARLHQQISASGLAVPHQQPEWGEVEVWHEMQAFAAPLPCIQGAGFPHNLQNRVVALQGPTDEADITLFGCSSQPPKRIPAGRKRE